MKQRIDSPAHQRQNMNWDQAANNLEDFKAQVQQRWRDLSDEQMERIAGRREQLARELEQSYGLTSEQAEKEVADFERGVAGQTMTGSGRGPTERAREFGSGNDPGSAPRNDHHRLH